MHVPLCPNGVNNALEQGTRNELVRGNNKLADNARLTISKRGDVTEEK